MRLYAQILTKLLENQTVQVVFPELQIDAEKLIEMRCYQALQKIKAIIEDESLEDAECFLRIEEIVRVLEEIGSDGGFRHDYF